MPGTVEVAREVWDYPGSSHFYLQRTHRVYDRDLERNALNVAPRWIAWLYRWLPNRWSWKGRAYDGEFRAPYYLWAVAAPQWRIAWLPARRMPDTGHRLGALVAGVVGHDGRWAL